MNGTTSSAVAEETTLLFGGWLLPFDELPDDKLKLLRVILLSVTTAAVVIGIPGNLLVILSILLMKSLRQLHHAFIINLALCDLGVMVMDMFVILGAYYGGEFYEKRAFLCELSGFICMMSCFGSLWSMMFIAVNRYLFILHNEIYKKVFDVKGTIIALIILWCCVTLLDIANWPFIGLGIHAFNPYGLHCSFVTTEDIFYNTFVYSGLAVLFPAIVIFCSYARILRTTQQLAEKLGNTSGGALMKRRQKEQKQLTRSLVTLFAIFCFCWFPLGTVVFLFGLGSSFINKIPLTAAVLIEVLAHLNSAINYIILGMTHSGFRKAYVAIFRALFRCKMVREVDANSVNGKTDVTG